MELLLAQVREAAATAARDLWAATGADPFARLPTEPPLLVADATRIALARAGSPYLRLALSAAFSAADRARATPPAARTEAAFLAAARTRATIAAHLGFPDVWSLALAIAGDTDTPAASASSSAPPASSPASSPPAPSSPALDAALARHLADPAPLLAALARTHAFDPSAITHLTITVADAPEPGRCFLLAPTDIRIRIWRRPNASATGTLRVLLHELGHAALATTTDLPPRSVDEAAAARFAAHLEDPAFNTSVLALPPAAATTLAAAERTRRATRRARLLAAAAAERAFYLSSGPPPFPDPLAWTDPGASHAYALAELL